MDAIVIERAERGLGFFERFLRRIANYDEYRLDKRLEAVEAIGKAAGETRAWTEELRKHRDGDGVVDRGPEISELWNNASRKIAQFDAQLAEECLVKAYGWRTGKWDRPEFAAIPRRVEEVYAEAMRLIGEFQPLLGKATR